MPKSSILDAEPAYCSADLYSRIVKLKDGRNLGYAEYGNFNGKPVLYCHGSPGSRLEAAALHETALRLDLRIIGIDRPGMGLSTFQGGRRILDFADDVTELADALDISRFSVIGISGGGPYVLACAYKMPWRITGAGIISGIGPIDEPDIAANMVAPIRLSLWLSHRAPWLMKILFTMITGWVRYKRDLFFWKCLSEPDRAALEQPIVADIWIKAVSEAFFSGTAGPVWDLGLFMQPWGFSPEEISIPVHIWHGGLDRNVPPVIAQQLIQRIPNCKARLFSREGHLSLWINQMEEIMETLVSQWRGDLIKQTSRYNLAVSSR